MTRKHIPDNELPPVTSSGTGAPRQTARRNEAAYGRRKEKPRKDSGAHSDVLGERALAAWRIEKQKMLGLRRGNPGNSGGKKGRSGRRPDIWLAWCQKLMLNRTTQRAIRRVIRDKAHPGHTAMIKMIRDSAFPATKNLDVSVRTSLEDILAHSYEKDGTSDA